MEKNEQLGYVKTNLLMSCDTRLAELYAELNTYIKTKEVGWRFASSKEADAERLIALQKPALKPTNAS